MSTTNTTANTTAISSEATSSLLPVSLIVFLGFFAISMMMPTVAIHVHSVLGYADVIAGGVVGLQSLATVCTRHTAGSVSDVRGPRAAVMRGLPLLTAGGVLALGAAQFTGPAALGLLLASRLVLGLGESLLLTGAMSWGIARVGPALSGKVIAWQGLGMFGALTLGAPAGLALAGRWGFAAVAVVAAILPMIGVAIGSGLAATVPIAGERLPLLGVARIIGRYGVVLAFAGAPYALIATFLGLWFGTNGWAGRELAVAAFGVGYVLMRLFFIHLPARYGAVRVARLSLCAALVGQLLLAWASGPVMGVIGALLGGVGFSLIYPALGTQLMRVAPPASRGMVIGGFSAFFDIAIGVSGPIGGLIAAGAGYRTMFLAGAVAQAGALLLLMAASDHDG